MDPHIALVQTNPTLGALTSNRANVLAQCLRAGSEGAQIICLPDSALTGAPLLGLADSIGFMAHAQANIQALAQELARHGAGDVPVFIGQQNVDDPRTSTPTLLLGAHLFTGEQATVVKNNVTVTATVGPHTPAKPSASSHLHLVLNSEPFVNTPWTERWQYWASIARRHKTPLAWVNLVGGQDEHVFDGGSFIVSVSGQLLTRAEHCKTGITYARLAHTQTAPRSAIEPPAENSWLRAERLYHAARLGLADYVNKNGFSSVLVGLSGGIDSTLVAALAVDALGPERVFGVSNPSQWSTEHSRTDAADLARRTGLQMTTVPIGGIVDAVQAELSLSGVAEENLQARLRAVIWMGIANQHGHLVLACGNKSELACGYSTMYGDAVGGYAPIKDIPKTTVWQLASWRNRWAELNGQQPPIPQNTIDKEPSAELRPDQRDSDTLPPYDVLDPLIDAYIVQGKSASDLLAAGFGRETVNHVITLINKAEFKRRQYPPGPKLSAHDLTTDRVMPLTNAFDPAVAYTHGTG